MDCCFLFTCGCYIVSSYINAVKTVLKLFILTDLSIVTFRQNNHEVWAGLIQKM